MTDTQLRLEYEIIGEKRQPEDGAVGGTKVSCFVPKDGLIRAKISDNTKLVACNWRFFSPTLCRLLLLVGEKETFFFSLCVVYFCTSWWEGNFSLLSVYNNQLIAEMMGYFDVDSSIYDYVGTPEGQVEFGITIYKDSFMSAPIESEQEIPVGYSVL